ncbi:MAG: metallophosphoesterase family protein [Planctomycetes bacterium]|nr:metallophosphoesterase family protein [Planctomycetota bacterium]
MHRALPLLLLAAVSCGRPTSDAPVPPVVTRPAPPPPEEPAFRFQEDYQTRRVPVEGPIRRGPYVQAVGTDRATICFETVEEVEGKAICDGRTSTGVRGRRHAIELKDLKPGTRYSYSIEPGGFSASFKTSPDAAGDLFFVAWGDSRTYYERLARVAALAAKDLPDFSVHSGDLVDEGTIEECWDRFFESAAPLLRTGAFWPSIGNHEIGAKQYFDLFVLPEPENYYTFIAGPAQFFILDANWQPRKDPKQLAWFAEEIRKSKARFRFVVLHHPLVSCPDDDFVFDKESSMYALYGRMIEEGKVNVVFQGHNHNYQRAERKEVVYITTGGAGAPLYPVGDLTPETKFAREVHHYVRVRLTGRKWSLECVDWSGRVIDSDERTVGP